MMQPGQVLLQTGFQELFSVHSPPLQPTENGKKNMGHHTIEKWTQL